ncbi:MAG: hypothetical protein AAGF95_18310 [Chloroflexota bacterium]
MRESTKPTIALLTHNINIQTSLKTITDRLETDLIIAQSIDALLSITINLIFWFPPQFDDKMYEQLQRICPHVLVLLQHKPQSPGQRTRAGPLIPATCLFIPFDPEEISIIVSSRLKTPRTQP